MIDAGQPRRHPIVVGVFCFAQELKKAVRGRRSETPPASAQSAVRPNSRERGVAFCDQPQTNVVVRERRLRRAEYGPHELVVEIGRPHGELRLLQCEQAVVVPWSLPENSKGKRVPPNQPGVRLLSLPNV